MSNPIIKLVEHKASSSDDRKFDPDYAEYEDNAINLRGKKLETNEDKIPSEFGDLFFSLINYSRFVNINPEEALERTNKKFIQRFQYLELESKKDGKKLDEMTLEEMDEYWEKAKKL